MSPFYTLCLFIVLVFVCCLISWGRDWPTSQLLRRVKPEDVQVHPETLQAITQSDFRWIATPEVERRIQQHCGHKGRTGWTAKEFPLNEKIIGQISPARPFGGPFEAVDHASQAIYTAANELFDLAITTPTLTEALQLATVAQVLRSRLDAVSSRALARADELTGGM